jgi:hypothetical protein
VNMFDCVACEVVTRMRALVVKQFASKAIA